MADEAKGNGKEDLSNKVIKGGFQIQLNIAGRTLTMNGYISDGETRAGINARMDEYQDIIDRQMVRAHRQDAEGQLKAHVANLEQMGNEYKKLVARKKQYGKLPTALETTLNNYDSTIEGCKKGIAHWTKEIEEATARLAIL